MTASSETPAVNPGYAPSQSNVVAGEGQSGFTPTQTQPSPVVNNPAPNTDATAGSTEQRPIATKVVEPVKAVTPYDQLTEGLTQRTKDVIQQVFNTSEDPNYDYNRFKADARRIASINILYKRAPWFMPNNRRIYMQNYVKVVALRAILGGNNALKKRLQQDKDFSFDKVYEGVLNN